VGISQIIASCLILILMKWTVWHVQLLQIEHQKIFQAMEVLVFKVNVMRDIQKVFSIFFDQDFAYDANGIFIHDLSLLEISSHKWRIFYVKKKPILGEKRNSIQMRIPQCETCLNRDVFIFNQDQGQKNTVLNCEEQILTLKFPLDFEGPKLFILPIDYKTYSFRLTQGVYQVYLSQKDLKHFVDLNIKPSLIIQSKHDISLQMGDKRWHIIKSKD
jgi:hypothetical protein